MQTQQQIGTMKAFKALQKQRRAQVAKPIQPVPGIKAAINKLNAPKLTGNPNPQAKAYGGGGTGIQGQASMNTGKLIQGGNSPKIQGSFKKGGKVKKTGTYKLHKNEQVVPAKVAKKVRKSGGFNARKYEATRKSVFGLKK